MTKTKKTRTTAQDRSVVKKIDYSQVAYLLSELANVQECLERLQKKTWTASVFVDNEEGTDGTAVSIEPENAKETLYLHQTHLETELRKYGIDIT